MSLFDSAVLPSSPPPASLPVPEGWLFEVAWEVCRQLGGIYTVIRSKVPGMIEQWGDRYCLIGPYDPQTAAVEFDKAEPPACLQPALEAVRALGLPVHFGRWLVTGRPQVILLDTRAALPRVGEFKYFFWEHHGISLPDHDQELNEVAAFGWLVCEFFRGLTRVRPPPASPVTAHFHEWMGSAAVPELRRERLPVGLVFTTHATLLGRYLAMSDPGFYDHLPFFDWQKEARHFAIEARVRLERAAAHGAHVFTTVSPVTALECRHLLGREPDRVLPNGLNIERFIVRHESENLHKIYKEKIHQFVTAHFFPSYSFNLDRTLYLFTSGRYEFRNKGFDLTLEAMARLNARLKEAGTALTVVLFLVTRRPFRSMLADVLNSKGLTDEMRQTCMAIKDQVGERLFQAAARGTFPDLNGLMDDYWRLRLRRAMQTVRTARLPLVVTHDLLDQERDEALNQVRRLNLVNQPDSPVKIVYHPDFINTTNPLFGLDYDQFVRGCHLGLFPSYYEPWGYTPLECLARGIPAVTSDLSGLGNYIQAQHPDCSRKGLFVVRRKHVADEQAAAELAGHLLEFSRLDLRDRITLRFRAQELAEQCDWKRLIVHYHTAHADAVRRLAAAP